MKTPLLSFLIIAVLFSSCSILKEPEPDYTTAMVGAYTQITDEYDPEAKKYLKTTITLNISKKDNSTLELLLAADVQFWNPTRKAVETGFSHITLTKVKATDAKNFTIDETANEYSSISPKPYLVAYKGKGAFNGENLAISMVAQLGMDASAVNLKMVKDR